MTDPTEKLRALGKTLEHAAEAVEDRIEDVAQESRDIAPLVEEARRVPWWGHVRRFWPLVLIAIAAAVFVFSGAWHELHLDRLDQHYDQLSIWSHAHPLLFRLGLILTLAAVTAMGLPGGAVLVLAGGIFLGVIEGALYAAIGDAIGASLLFLAAQRAMNDGDNHPSSALVERLRTGFSEHPVSYAMFLRLVPLFPFGAVSVALAWLGCRYRMFLWTTILGVLPSLIVYAAIGAGVAPTLEAHLDIDAGLFAQPRFLIPLIVLALLSLIPVLLGLRRAPRIPR
jgi:uncharacterized membrane protein YdjX (TVP38/TMEM64 family)